MTDSNKNPKVLIAAGTGHITEVEMIKGLRSQGINIHAAFNSTSPHLSALRESGVPTRTLDLKSNADFRGVMQIRRWIKNEGFDILHGLANRQVANFIWASYGRPNKLIAYRGAIGHVSRWDPTCYLKWLNPRVNQIICVSQAVKNDLKNSGVDQEKLTTIYKGHRLSWYADIDRQNSRNFINQEFAIPRNAFVVGMAANMRRVKGADILLKALEHSPTYVHALLIGALRDPKLKKLTQKNTLKNRVHLAGYRRDATRLIGGFDLNCAPSRGREGLTKSILEGMGQGVPSAVSNAGGLPELVKNGVNGYVFPIGDYLALSEKIATIASDKELAKNLGDKGKEIFQSVFHCENTIKETKSVYKKLMQ
jgi:glycosyltransferase involved in cell wall biosynthesis